MHRLFSIGLAALAIALQERLKIRATLKISRKRSRGRERPVGLDRVLGISFAEGEEKKRAREQSFQGLGKEIFAFMLVQAVYVFFCILTRDPSLLHVRSKKNATG